MSQTNLTGSDLQTIDRLLGRSEGVTHWEAYFAIHGQNRTGITADDVKRYMQKHATPMKRGIIVLKRRSGNTKCIVYTRQPSLPIT